MEISKIIIENFRSIRKQEICLKNKKMFILLGINEAGKSNILKAISLKEESTIFKSYQKDCNKKEKNKEDIKITYALEANWDSYLNEFSKTATIPKKLIDNLKVNKLEKIVFINPKNEKSSGFFLNLKNNIKGIENFVIHEEQIKAKEENNTLKDTAGNITNTLDKEKLEKFIEKRFYSLFEKNIPKVIFWESKSSYLINQEVNLREFKENLEKSVVLKNCFLIAGYEKEDIKSEIEEALTNTSSKSSLASTLSGKVTEFVNKAWKNHDIEFAIYIDGDSLKFYVSDKCDENKTRYVPEDRSDGFKQFISILLNLSIASQEKELKNTIILLDEPEMHLHPSGQKFLLDELRKISKKNKVFFATHSIFMVDKENLDNNYSVEKIEEETKIEQILQDNPLKEEVLYEALGTSILEHINPNVILFEGKTDRDIFELYKKKFSDLEDLKIPNITSISADGAKQIIKYTKFFNTKTAIIKGFVVFDSDNEGREQKKRILKQDNYNEENVFEINNLISEDKSKKKDHALEDLFEKKIIEDAIENSLDRKFSIEEQNPFEKQIKDIYKKKEINNKKTKEEFKKKFLKKVNEMKEKDLKKQKYYGFFKNLIEKINS